MIPWNMINKWWNMISFISDSNELSTMIIPFRVTVEKLRGWHPSETNKRLAGPCQPLAGPSSWQHGNVFAKTIKEYPFYVMKKIHFLSLSSKKNLVRRKLGPPIHEVHHVYLSYWNAAAVIAISPRRQGPLKARRSRFSSGWRLPDPRNDMEQKELELLRRLGRLGTKGNDGWNTVKYGKIRDNERNWKKGHESWRNYCFEIARIWSQHYDIVVGSSCNTSLGFRIPFRTGQTNCLGSPDITNRVEEINWGRSLGFSQSLNGEPLLYHIIIYIILMAKKDEHGWTAHLVLVGGLEHFYCPIYWEFHFIPTDFHSIIFQRGRAQPPTSTWWSPQVWPMVTGVPRKARAWAVALEVLRGMPATFQSLELDRGQRGDI